MKKRILSALLCLCMVMALMPTVAFAEPKSYNLWVGGVEVTSDNASNITGGGITGKVTYDDSTKTLTLDNVNIDSVYSFENSAGTTDSAGIYVSGDFNNDDLTIKLVGENTITGQLPGSEISGYGFFAKGFSTNLIFDGSGSLNISAADGKTGETPGETNSWSVAIYANGSVNVGAQCTITATSGVADNTSAAIYANGSVNVGDQCTITATSGEDSNISAAIYANDGVKVGAQCTITATSGVASYISAAIYCSDLTLEGAKVSAGSSARDAAVKAENTNHFSPIGYKYIKIEKGDPAPSTPVTNIAATVTAPALGQKPDYDPVIVANPADSVDLEKVYWYKIAVADFTGTDEDDWDEMEADEVFEDGYYYSVDMYFNPNEGYKLTESTTGTVNGKPHDSTYGNVFGEKFSNYGAYLRGLFEPLAVEYTIDLPFSLAVKLTGDEKPAKETFKFEIYDLGVEDAKFEIVKDSITAENIAFDENGVALIEGSLKIKVTGEDQLRNLTEGFSVRMVKGSTKGWTYASEQWRIEPSFENDALDPKIAAREIVDGKISEANANGMSFSVGYEAVTEPETPQTGDSSMMVLWIALFVASGAGATAIYSRKRKSSAK